MGRIWRTSSFFTTYNKRIEHLSDILKVGDEIVVKVMGNDRVWKFRFGTFFWWNQT